MMRKLRAVEELARRPIFAIAVSAHALRDARLYALRAGYRPFLLSPLRANELVATAHSAYLAIRERQPLSAKAHSSRCSLNLGP
jgi:CheY-like chemotaxis protein